MNPQRVVIMAAGGGHRWHNYQNRPKQLLEIDGEPIIKRTIRLLRERGITDIYVTVKEIGQYGKLDASEYITKPNEVAIDRVWGARELAPCIFLFGDTYYGEKSVDVILSDKHDYRFFGKASGDKVKRNREIYAIKANDFVIQKAGEFRQMYVDKIVRKCLGGHLLIYCLDIPINPRVREYTATASQIIPIFTELNDETIDFDKPSDFIRWNMQSNRKIKRLQATPRPQRAIVPMRRRSMSHKSAPIKTYYPLSRMNYDVLHHFLSKIPPDIDLVIGIPRDGIMVAYLISIYRNIPMTDLTSFCAGIIYKSGIKHRQETEIKNILMVDDICATGRAMRDARAQIKDHVNGYNLYCGALYFNKRLNTDFSIDFYGCDLVGPRAYEWTIADAFYLPTTMMDFDGILCPDCPHEDDDDGERYKHWLETVPLKIRPMNIGTIITWRREKYRDITVAWLKKNKITYGELIMADREKWPGPAEFKAHCYKSKGARLLIDSSAKQAERIYQLTGRPTVCSETNESWGVQ